MKKSLSPQVTIWNKNFTCMLIVGVIQNLSTTLTGSLITSYAASLGAAPMLAGVIAGMLYYGVALAARPLAGPVQMIGDRRKLLLLLYAVGAVAYAGYVLVPSVPVLMVFRFLTGVQLSITSTLNLTLASGSIPAEKTASALGYFAVACTLGSVLGPVVGIQIRDLGMALGGERTGYVAAFLFAALINAAVLLPAFLLDPQPAPAEKDGVKTAWYRNIAEVSVIVPSLIIMLGYMPYYLYTTYVVQLAQERGIGSVSAIFLVFAAVMAVTRPLMGWLMERWGIFKVVLPSLAVYGLAFFGSGKAESVGALMIFSVICALGYSNILPGLQALCLQSTTNARRALASNTYYLGMDIGCTVAPIIFGGWLYPLLGSYSRMFLLSGIPAIMAAVLLVLFWPSFKQRREVLDRLDEAD